MDWKIEYLLNNCSYEKIKYYEMSRAQKNSVIAYFKNFDSKKPKETDSFIMLHVPMEILKSLIMQIDSMSHYKNFDNYHAYYKSKVQLTEREEIWPLFLDTCFGCVIDDGWKRFHCYVDSGIEEVPCLLLEDS